MKRSTEKSLLSSEQRTKNKDCNFQDSWLTSDWAAEPKCHHLIGLEKRLNNHLSVTWKLHFVALEPPTAVEHQYTWMTEIFASQCVQVLYTLRSIMFTGLGRYLKVSIHLLGVYGAYSYLASSRCRHTASPRWGRSNRGRGCHSCSCSKGCRRPRLSNTCHIHSTLCWRPSCQACTFHGQSSYWDKSWSWTEKCFHLADTVCEI